MIHNRHIDLRECVETEQPGYEANGLRNVRQIARQREMENPRYIVPSTHGVHSEINCSPDIF